MSDNKELRAKLLAMPAEQRRAALEWLRRVHASLEANRQPDPRQAHCDAVAAELLDEIDI